MISFRINTFGDKNGPAIFGNRLKEGLENRKWVFNLNNPDMNIVFASGEYLRNKINVLRLDNLYFDSKNTIGNTDELNKKIKDSFYSFDKIIFQSEFAKCQYFSHFGKINKPYKVIYNGVPKLFCSKGKKAKYPFSKTFICSADWRAHKRLDAIIEGINSFQDKSIGLVVLGNCNNKKSTKNVIYLGKKHHSELPYYIRGADVGVHLSWLDCSPNVVYEFLACGLPVLCSHNGGTKEIVKEDGITLKLEKDYEFNRVDLYNPPKPDSDLVYWGMKEMLEKHYQVNRKDLYMRHVVDRYIDFIME